MLVTEPPRFIFHGNAMPFGGRITKKNNTPAFSAIPGPPTAALAVVGGLSRATSGALKPHEAFSWGATVAEAKGDRVSDVHFRTTVTSSISKVSAKNDPHVFQAVLLRVTLVSDHANLGPASIRIPEALFQGMLLGGDPIEVDQNNDLNTSPTMDRFEDRYQTSRAFFNRHQNPLTPGAVRFGDPIPRTSGGYAITSIVHRVRWRGKSFPGNVLRLDGFGTIFFGEVLMNENRRRLTMVRLAMGSALGAEAAYAEADPNGTWGT